MVGCSTGGHGYARSVRSAEAMEGKREARARAWEEWGVRASEERVLGRLPIGIEAWGMRQQWWGHGKCMMDAWTFR